MDQPPQPRPSISDASAATLGPIPLFDAQIRFLNDSYLSFFQERKRIEENYMDSLTKLHRKIKSVDSYLDDRGEISTTRSSWSEVVDNIEREVQARQAFCGTLSVDVITPLTTLKDTQERTRKRIKEDLKDSGAAYHDYADNILPKLKSKYIKKFAEVEEQKRANASPQVAPPQNPTDHHPLGNSRSNPSLPSRPAVTAPQPLKALDRRPSGGGPPRNRSPPTAGAFSDLAHQGRGKLNQLIGFLDKGGPGGGGLGGNRENSALRNVRSKREMEEADKDYRKGVHWLETLRLRRTKILEGGFKSLELFVEEASTVVKRSLDRYLDNLTATYATQMQLSSHTRTTLDRISPEKDLSRLRASIPRSLASAIPDQILYEHGLVGPCNDLCFGISLVDYAVAKGLQDNEVPKVVRICIREIDDRGLDSEGIYRVSGRQANVQYLQHLIEKDESAFEFDPRKDDVFAVASLFKLYLRELPEPVFKFSLPDRVQHTEERAEHQANNFKLLRAKMRRLPPVHQATLRAIIEHLARVVSRSERNKMDAKNLAISFGGVIFGEDEMPKPGDLLNVHTAKDTLMEDLIMNAHTLFDEPGAHHSPPLPPTPYGEPIPEIVYGSKTTKVAKLPPIPPISSQPSSPQDFTPKLPNRPLSSIHPSSRAFPGSPTRERAIPLPSRSENSSAETPPSSPSRRERSSSSSQASHTREESEQSHSQEQADGLPSQSAQATAMSTLINNLRVSNMLPPHPPPNANA